MPRPESGQRGRGGGGFHHVAARTTPHGVHRAHRVHRAHETTKRRKSAAKHEGPFLGCYDPAYLFLPPCGTMSLAWVERTVLWSRQPPLSPSPSLVRPASVSGATSCPSGAGYARFSLGGPNGQEVVRGEPHLRGDRRHAVRSVRRARDRAVGSGH